MAYYRRRKTYRGSVSLLMTFLLGVALGMSVMYLFMTLISGDEGSDSSVRAALRPDKPLNADTTLQYITEGQGRYIVPAISPDRLLRVWRNVITELRPVAVVLRQGDSEDPRTVREALDLLAALPLPPVVLMEPADLIPPAGPDAKNTPDTIPDRVLGTLRQWGGSGWLGPCLAYPAAEDQVSLFGLSMTSEAAVRLGLEINRILLEHGMAPVVRPFPGAPTGHSPEGYPCILESDFDVLAEMVAPFLQAIQAGTPAVLAAQVVVPALDARRPPRPACASSVIIRELLREKWQYDGLILGDATIPPDIVDEGEPPAWPVRCLAAGCDAVLVDFDHQDTAVGMLMSFDLRALPADQLAQSAQRLERFRARYGGTKFIPSKQSLDSEEQQAPQPAGEALLPVNQPEMAPSADDIPLNSHPEDMPPEDGTTTAVNAVSALPEDTMVSQPDVMDHPVPVTTAAPSGEEDPAALAQPKPTDPDLAPSPSEADPKPEGVPETSAAPEPSAQLTVTHPPEAPFIEHRIEPGEELAAIARRYGVSLSDLIQWNGITDPDRIVAGTRLKIYGVRMSELPSAKAKPPTQNEPAQDLVSDAAKNNIAPSGTRPAAEVSPAEPEIKIPLQTVTSSIDDDTPYEIYVVQPGDTLYRIAGKYGTSLKELMRINNIQDKNLVKIGSKIKVPLRAGRSPEPSPVSE